MDVLTVEQFRHALPTKFKNTVNQELIDSINKTLGDPELYEQYRDNLLSYAHIMRDGKFKMQDYISAIKYCSHKIMGATNIDAFIKTFPNRYQNYLANGTAPKDIASYVTAYNKSKLVNLIMEQSLIPSWILNQDLYQKALNVQYELMTSANSEKVRSDAANSLLNHLKPPEVQKVELDIGIKEDAGVTAMKNALAELAAQHKRMIELGIIDAKTVAEQQIVTKVIEHEPK